MYDPCRRWSGCEIVFENLSGNLRAHLPGFDPWWGGQALALGGKDPWPPHQPHVIQFKGTMFP
jgi:hypothetical protein